MRSFCGAVGLLLTILLFSSCGAHYEREDKHTLYYRIMATNDTLDYMTKEWHLLLNRAVQDKRFADLAANRLKMGEFLSRSRNDIANLRVSKDALPLVDSELAFLLTRATVASEIYTKFEPFNEMTPDAAIAEQKGLLANDVLNEARWHALMKRSLKAFARRNKLDVKR